MQQACNPHQIYLYLSGELKGRERKRFEYHLSHCEICQQTLADARQAMAQMSSDAISPDPMLCENVMRAVRERPNRKPRGLTFVRRLRRMLTVRHLAWEVVLSASMILLLIYVRPASETRTGNSSVLSWEDDFYAEADWMSQEIERVDSGGLISSYISTELNTDSENETEWLSPVTMNLETIREEVQDIVQGIYGI